jgi:hypothetical protein
MPKQDFPESRAVGCRTVKSENTNDSQERSLCSVVTLFDFSRFEGCCNVCCVIQPASPTAELHCLFVKPTSHVS